MIQLDAVIIIIVKTKVSYILILIYYSDEKIGGLPNSGMAMTEASEFTIYFTGLVFPIK